MVVHLCVFFHAEHPKCFASWPAGSPACVRLVSLCKIHFCCTSKRMACITCVYHSQLARLCICEPLLSLFVRLSVYKLDDFDVFPFCDDVCPPLGCYLRSFAVMSLRCAALALCSLTPPPPWFRQTSVVLLGLWWCAMCWFARVCCVGGSGTEQ